MNADHDATGPGRLEIRADDPNLTPYAGLAIVGELARRTRLVELIDAELGVVRTARAIKRRRRGLSAGALVVSLAECQIAGAECFDDIENVRADRAGASLGAPVELWVSSAWQVDDDAGAAQVDEGDERLGGVEAEAAVADQADAAVQSFEAAVGSTCRMRVMARI